MALKKQRQKKAQIVTQNPDTAGLPKKQKRMLGVIALTSIVTILGAIVLGVYACLLYTSPSPRDRTRSRMPSSA